MPNAAAYQFRALSHQTLVVGYHTQTRRQLSRHQDVSTTVERRCILLDTIESIVVLLWVHARILFWPKECARKIEAKKRPNVLHIRPQSESVYIKLRFTREEQCACAQVMRDYPLDSVCVCSVCAHRCQQHVACRVARCG